MNIHPAFVHFPIAFLTIYALFECVPSRKLRQNKTWQTIKATLLILGALSGFVTFQTGELAEEIYGEHPLTEMHSLWAAITLWIFGITSVVYATAMSNNFLTVSISRKIKIGSVLEKILTNSLKACTFIFNTRFIVIPLTLAGLAAITITGALGGALVYGPDVDPVVGFIYNIFF